MRGRQNSHLSLIFLWKTQHKWDSVSNLHLLSCIFDFKLYLLLFWFEFCFFFFLFMTADCISCVWVHLAFFFSLWKTTWVRAPFEDLLQWSMICFSLLMSRLKKKKIIKDLFLADCVAGWKERGSALLLWAGWKPSDVGQPGKKKQILAELVDESMRRLPPSTRWRPWSLQYMDFHPLPAWFL